MLQKKLKANKPAIGPSRDKSGGGCEGWQREAEGWDWAEIGGLAGNSVLEGAMGARGGEAGAGAGAWLELLLLLVLLRRLTDCDWAS